MKYYQPFLEVYEDANHIFHYTSHYQNIQNEGILEDCVGLYLIDFLNSNLEEYKKSIESNKSAFLETKNEKITIDFIDEFLMWLQELGRNCRIDSFIYDFFITKMICDTSYSVVHKKNKIIYYDHVNTKQLKKWYSILMSVITLQERYRKLVDATLNIQTRKYDDSAVALEESVKKFKDLIFTDLKYTNRLNVVSNGKRNSEKQSSFVRSAKSAADAVRNARKENLNINLLPTTKLYSIEEALYFEFTEMFKKGYRINRCRLCGNYFILKTSVDKKYCSIPFRDGKTCSKIAAKLKFEESLNDPYLNEYYKYTRKIYQREFRKTASGVTSTAYYEWSGTVQELRKNYVRDREKIIYDRSLTRKEVNSQKKSLGETFINALYDVATDFSNET